MNKHFVHGFIGKGGTTLKNFEDGGAVVSLSLATNERWKDKTSGEPKERTDWHRVVARGNLAKTIDQYFSEGQEAIFIGKSRTRKYQDADGKDCYISELHVDEFNFCGSKKNLPNGESPEFPQPTQKELEEIPF